MRSFFSVIAFFVLAYLGMWIGTQQNGEVGAWIGGIIGGAIGLYISHTIEKNKPQKVGGVSSKSSYAPPKKYQVGDKVITNLAGVTFEGRQNTLAELEEGDIIDLSREENNPHDKNAILVTRKGKTLGYIKRELAEIIAPIIDDGMVHSGQAFCGRVEKITGGGSHSIGVVIGFTIPSSEYFITEANIELDERYPTFFSK